MAPQQTIKYPSIKVTYIIDDYSYIPTNIMYPLSKSESWKQFDELTDDKGNMLVTFGGFLIESGNKKVLMDLGLGTEKVNFPGFGMVSGKGYLQSLKKCRNKPRRYHRCFLYPFTYGSLWLDFDRKRWKKSINVS